MNDKIDFVIMWVDPNDPKWQKEKAKYTPEKNTDSSARRYRDWDNLQYWFRGVERYAPWVDNIYFVTYGHIPKWLNTNHPKLRIVKHDEFIPKKYLPTFNSHTIELNLHRIKELSENFVFFNDDFFLINPTKPSTFFKNSIPLDAACMYANIPSLENRVIDSVFINDMSVINQHFQLRKTVTRDFFKWFNYKNGKYLYNNVVLSAYKSFVGIHFSHLPASFAKATFREVWEKEEKILDNTCLDKFRNADNVNQWLIKYWQICTGRFAPRNIRWGKYYEYNMGYDELRRIFVSKRYKAICLNDTVEDEEFEKAKEITNSLFAKKLPNKSEFEK